MSATSGSPPRRYEVLALDHLRVGPDEGGRACGARARRRPRSGAGRRTSGGSAPARHLSPGSATIAAAARSPTRPTSAVAMTRLPDSGVVEGQAASRPARSPPGRRPAPGRPASVMSQRTLEATGRLNRPQVRAGRDRGGEGQGRPGAGQRQCGRTGDSTLPDGIKQKEERVRRGRRRLGQVTRLTSSRSCRPRPAARRRAGRGSREPSRRRGPGSTSASGARNPATAVVSPIPATRSVSRASVTITSRRRVAASRRSVWVRPRPSIAPVSSPPGACSRRRGRSADDRPAPAPRADGAGRCT